MPKKNADKAPAADADAFEIIDGGVRVQLGDEKHVLKFSKRAMLRIDGFTRIMREGGPLTQIAVSLLCMMEDPGDHDIYSLFDLLDTTDKEQMGRIGAAIEKATEISGLVPDKKNSTVDVGKS